MFYILRILILKVNSLSVLFTKMKRKPPSPSLCLSLPRFKFCVAKNYSLVYNNAYLKIEK